MDSLAFQKHLTKFMAMSFSIWCKVKHMQEFLGIYDCWNGTKDQISDTCRDSKSQKGFLIC